VHSRPGRCYCYGISAGALLKCLIQIGGCETLLCAWLFFLMFYRVVLTVLYFIVRICFVYLLPVGSVVAFQKRFPTGYEKKCDFFQSFCDHLDLPYFLSWSVLWIWNYFFSDSDPIFVTSFGSRPSLTINSDSILHPTLIVLSFTIPTIIQAFSWYFKAYFLENVRLMCL
jgi:hypothetical protein